MTNFARTLASLKKTQVVIPVLRAAMADPDFESFQVPVRGWRAGVRQFDGWFHPSSQASWTARQLTLYLRHGGEMLPEPPKLEYVYAVTQGSFWHEFHQRVLLKRGILRQNAGTTAKDSIEKRVEIPLVDEEHNLRGHADGQMATADDELFEFKTSTGWKIAEYDSEDVLRAKNPFGYWHQAQDYLMIAGLPKMRYVMMSMASPYPMQEFIVHADVHHQRRQRAKYTEAIAAARDGILPEACCGIGSKQAKACPVREFCSIGRMS